MTTNGADGELRADIVAEHRIGFEVRREISRDLIMDFASLGSFIAV